MYEFLDRLVTIAIPRIRDFRGISSRAFDGRGNYSLGVKEQIIFPEIEYDKIDTLRGLNISITTTAKTDDEARALLSAFRFRSRPEDHHAKLAVVNRDQKRRKTVAKFAAGGPRCSTPSTTPSAPTRIVRRRGRNCSSCRETPRPCDFATGAG